MAFQKPRKDSRLESFILKLVICLWTLAYVAVQSPLARAASPSEPDYGSGQKPPVTLKKHFIAPEGKTLPEGVARLRVPYQVQSGDTSYDAAGHQSKSSFKAKGTGSAFVLEYGLSDRLSLQWVTRFYHNQSVLLDAAHFKGSPAFQDLKSKAYSQSFAKLGPGITPETLVPALEKATSKLLADKGACGGQPANCLTLINQNALMAPIDLTEANTGLPGLFIKAGTPIKDGLAAYGRQVDGMVEQKILAGASTYERKGAQGIGDSELGLLYQAYDSAWVSYSLGVGIRLPTGRCTHLGEDDLPTSRCTTDVALRQNLDILPLSNLMVSWQHQTEQMLRKGHYGTQGQSQEQVARNRARQVGFIVLKPSLAFLNPTLAVITLKGGLAYDYDSALVSKREGTVLTGQGNEVVNQVYGVGLDGTVVQWPLALEVEVNEPLQGRNKSVAPSTVLTTLKAYARF